MARDTHTPSHAQSGPGRRWTPLGLAGLAIVASPLLARLVRPLYAMGSGDGPSFPSPAMIGVLAAVLLAGAGLIVGIRELQRDERPWPAWLGTVVCGLIVVFWVVFAAAEVVSPH